ncbi:MAG: HyaD/HybD family hydrogenase maturation endopeptidase [Myxococcales bacterium]|nr:HyaD/HybD family hydrogenase maturation endopeptidase [Myxococcales bacterium]
MTAPRIVVLGVGNLLMADEGLGVRCVERLAGDARLPQFVRLVDGGTSTHELLEDLEDLDGLVIVDAVVTGAPPGTVVRLEGTEVPFAFSHKLSPHQHGINDLLATLTLLGRAPRQVVLLGVVPVSLTLSMDLSAEVEALMPGLMTRVTDEVQRLVAGEHGS